MLLKRCTRVREGVDVIELDDTRRAHILADVDALTDDALRALAVAYRPLPVLRPRSGRSARVRSDFRGHGWHHRSAAASARIAADLGIVEQGARC